MIWNAPVTFSSDQFSYAKGLFVAEVSDLQLKQDRFRIQSKRTGKYEHFCLYKTVRDADQDVLMWVFKPLNRQLLCEVRILND